MQINPSLEKHFNRFVLRAFGACLVALCGVLLVAGLFWAMRDIIPPALAIALAVIGIMAWLFGARAAFDEVIPDIQARFEQASDEELNRVLSVHPFGSDMHQLALAVVRARLEADPAR